MHVVAMLPVLLGLFLLVMLMDRETGTASGNGGGDLLLHPVRPSMLRLLPRLVLLVLHAPTNVVA